MVKLKRLKIHQYRNVRPGTELRFDDLRNLVLGKNGSGKTTLLGLIATVSGHDFERLADEEFDLEYEMRCELAVCRVALSNKRVELALGRSETAYRFEISLLEQATGQEFRAVGTPDDTTVLEVGAPARTQHAINPFRRYFFLRLSGELSSKLFVRVGASFYAEQIGSPFRFDESLDCFLAMTGRASTIPGVESPSEARASLSVGGQDALGKPNRYSVRDHQYFPTTFALDLGRALADAHSPVELDASIRQERGDVTMKLLTEATALLGYARLSVQASVKAEYASRDIAGWTFEIQGFTFNLVRDDASRMHHDLLSFGQKRLLAFFYYLACNARYVIADELVNGLHRSWIEACMYALGERQAFLTSQNPLLFDYIEFDSVEQAQARFITCKTELVDGTEQLVWENMSRDDADAFYRGYEAEIEGVGDVLINRGLW